jgi:hypothetical protein
MGDDFAGESDLNEDSVDNMQRILTTGSGKANLTEETVVFEPKGFFRSFGLLLREQTRLWPWYLVL